MSRTQEGASLKEPVTALVLLGPTGVGKSPLGRCLEKRGIGGRRWHHFEFGEELRALASGRRRLASLSANELATIRRVLSTGALLEDHEFPIAEKIFQDFVQRRKVGPKDVVVLDGLPRHKGQARAMEAHVRVVAVVRLWAPAKVVWERLRRNTGGDRTGRTDDRPHQVRRRLRIYRRNIVPLASFYRRQGVALLTVRVGVDTQPAQILSKLRDEFGLARILSRG